MFQKGMLCQSHTDSFTAGLVGLYGTCLAGEPPGCCSRQAFQAFLNVSLSPSWDPSVLWNTVQNQRK